MKQTKANKIQIDGTWAATPAPGASGNPNVQFNEQQIRIMAVIREKDEQVQAALARNCALRADLTIALEKIKQLEASIGTKPPVPVPAQTGEAKAMS